MTTARIMSIPINPPTSRSLKLAQRSKEREVAALSESQILELKGEALYTAIQALNIDASSAVAKDNIINNNRYSGYPQLARAILLLARREEFSKFKTPTDGKVPLENIAQQFANNIGKDGIWFILNMEDYEGEGIGKLKDAILTRWKEKNAAHLNPSITFKDIIVRTVALVS